MWPCIACSIRDFVAFLRCLCALNRGRRKSALSIHQLGPPDTALAVQACRVCENRDGRSARSIASVSPSLWHALLQFRPLVAIPTGILSDPRCRVRMAWVSAWCRNGSETAFCAVCWPARGCVRRLPTRTRSVCNSSSRGVAALFACALFLVAGFGEPDPSCHAGAAGPARRRSRAVLVSLDDTWQLGSFRIWLGSWHRLCHLHCWSAHSRTKRGCVGAAFSSLARCRRPFRGGIIDTTCARPGTGDKFNNPRKEGYRTRLAHPTPRARIRAHGPCGRPRYWEPCHA